MVTDTTIEVRNVCTQVHLSFDRATGVAEWRDKRVFGDSPVLCTIDSVAPLPVDMHNVLLGLDRKHRLKHNWDRIKSTNGEVQALVYAAHHYRANPI